MQKALLDQFRQLIAARTGLYFRLQDAGMDACVTKPIQPDELYRVIGDVVTASRAGK